MSSINPTCKYFHLALQTCLGKHTSWAAGSSEHTLKFSPAILTPRAPDTQTMHRRSASRDHVTCPAGNPCQSCMLVRIPCSVVMMDSTVENCRNIPFDVYHNSPLHVPHLQYTPEVTPPIVCAFNCTANNEKQVSGHPGAKTSTFLHGSYIDMADRFIRI